MELRVEDVGDEGQQEEQGGDQEGGRVEDEGELLPLLLLLPGVTHSEGDLQVNRWLSGGVELQMKDESDNKVPGVPGGRSDRSLSCCRCGSPSRPPRSPGSWPPGFPAV